MKTLSVKTIIVGISTVLLASKVFPKAVDIAETVIVLNTIPIVTPSVDIEVPEIEEILFLTSHERFLEALGFRESSNRYDTINRYGYLGKYQFSRTLLNNLGYENISTRKFLTNPYLQEQAMQELLIHNSEILSAYIEEYDGTTVHGIYVTKSGILAAAHLLGPTKVKNWFKTGRDFKDGLGTRLTSYIKKFSGYDLDI